MALIIHLDGYASNRKHRHPRFHVASLQNHIRYGVVDGKPLKAVRSTVNPATTIRPDSLKALCCRSTHHELIVIFQL